MTDSLIPIRRIAVPAVSAFVLMLAVGCKAFHSTPQVLTDGIRLVTKPDLSLPAADNQSGNAVAPAGTPAKQAGITELMLRRLPDIDFGRRLVDYGQVQLVSYPEDTDDPDGLNGPQLPPQGVTAAVTAAPPIGGPRIPPRRLAGATKHTQQASLHRTTTIPIDLANALAMGGAGHLQIQLARQRVIEAQTRLLESKALCLPSLRFGVGWNRHEGRIQATNGDIVEVSRNSQFVGVGAGWGTAPLAGGSGGPLRLMVNLSLSDAIFEKRVSAWLVDAEFSGESATVNDSLLDIAVAYFNLLEAHGLLANTRVGLGAADEMINMTTAFAREGAGAQSEVDRATTERAFWQQSVEDAQRRTVAASAELIRLLRLDPTGELTPAETVVVPLELVDPDIPVQELIRLALAGRPELAQHQSIVQARLMQWNQEHWRPWLPHLQAGISAGTFGGGQGSTFADDAGRSDLDLLAVWEVRNLGIGNIARNGRRASQMRQAQIQAEWLQDQIVAQTVTAASDVASYRRQIDTAEGRIAAAGESYRLNAERVSQGEGLPIELLQAIRAQTSALDAYTRAVAEYNRAQYRLLRSLGRPPEAPDSGSSLGQEVDLPPEFPQPSAPIITATADSGQPSLRSLR